MTFLTTPPHSPAMHRTTAHGAQISHMVSLRGWRARGKHAHDRLMQRRSAAPLDSDCFYNQDISAGPKKLKALKKKVKKHGEALQALAKQLDAPQDLLPELQRIQQQLEELVAREPAGLAMAGMMEDSTSSSSSSSSEDEDCMQETSTVKTQALPQAPPMPDPTITPGAAGRVLVCTGKDCSRKGAAETLAAFESATAAHDGVQVIACKCLGKCKQAPVARIKVQGSTKSVLHTHLEPTHAQVLCAGYFVPVPQLAEPVSESCEVDEPLLVGAV